MYSDRTYFIVTKATFYIDNIKFQVHLEQNWIEKFFGTMPYFAYYIIGQNFSFLPSPSRILMSMVDVALFFFIIPFTEIHRYQSEQTKIKNYSFYHRLFFGPTTNLLIFFITTFEWNSFFFLYTASLSGWLIKYYRVF